MDMTAKEQIKYLEERVRQADFDMCVRDAVLQDFLDKQKANVERLSKLDEIMSRIDRLESELKAKDRELKAKDRMIADLTAKLENAERSRKS